MNQAEFDQAVAGLPFARQAFFTTSGSTNDIVTAWASEGQQGLCLACADEQTSGRGRAGRSWITPSGAALAFSLLLDSWRAPQGNLLGLVSGLGALAVCEALEERFQLAPAIKWPNDVLLGGRKVCGTLAEAHWSGSRLSALVLGIGINVAPPSVPPSDLLNFPATCIEEELQAKVDPVGLLRSILERLIAWKDGLENEDFIRAWEKHLAFKGETVHLVGGERPVEGEILGLTPDGRLRLRANGAEQAFNIGEIQIRR